MIEISTCLRSSSDAEECSPSGWAVQRDAAVQLLAQVVELYCVFGGLPHVCSTGGETWRKGASTTSIYEQYVYSILAQEYR